MIPIIYVHDHSHQISCGILNGFTKMEVSINGGAPLAGWWMENPTEMNDNSGYPYFRNEIWGVRHGGFPVEAEVPAAGGSEPWVEARRDPSVEMGEVFYCSLENIGHPWKSRNEMVVF